MNDRGYLIEIQYSLFVERKGDIFGSSGKCHRIYYLGKKQRKTLKGSLCSRWYPGSQGVSLRWMPLGQRLSCLCLINSSRLFNNKKEVIPTLIINTGNQIHQHKILSDFFFSLKLPLWRLVCSNTRICSNSNFGIQRKNIM